MVKLTNDERALLERLSAEGKVTALKSGEIGIARALEQGDLVFLVPDGSGSAVITPRGSAFACRVRERDEANKSPLGFL